MSHLFFSYSRNDTEAALKIINGLRGVGFIIWQDVTHVKGGENWIKSIYHNIETSEGMLLLWSVATKQSTWANKEIDQALLKNKTIYPLLLDDTPLDDRIATFNATSVDDISKLVPELPVAARRKRLGFDLAKTMVDQDVMGTEHWAVDGDPLISVPLFESSYCKAAVVASPDTMVGQPRMLQICLHFARDVDKVLVSDVYHQFKHTYTGGTEAFIALHITGPSYLNKYRLDDRNTAHWSDAVDTTYEAVKELSQIQRPVLHIFSQSPVAFNFALGMKFWRFWHINLYNWAGKNTELPYNPVMEILPE